MQKYVIALYIRLSLEDYKYDSMSIENQHLALNEFVSSMPESDNAEVLEFIDNGYSGTNFERPKVQELIEMVRANKIDCIIVKDFSRFGRNSIETGYFIKRVFPLFHTRFISINDGFDSDQHKGDTGGMDVAFKYLISEYYSRDMSIKTKSAKYAKMQRGEYQSNHKVKGIVVVGDNAEDGAFLHAQLRQEHFIGGNHLGKRRRLQHMQIGYRRDHNAGQGFRAAELEQTVLQHSRVMRVALFQFTEQNIHTVFVVAVLADLAFQNHIHHRVEVALIQRGFVQDIQNQRCQKHNSALVPELVFPAGGCRVLFGVEHQRIGKLHSVLIGFQIRYRIVMPAKMHKVNDRYGDAVFFHSTAEGIGQLPLGVQKEVGAAALQGIRFYKEAGLTAAGTADHDRVQVALVPIGIIAEADILGKNDFLPRVLAVAVAFVQFPSIAPTGRAVFLAGAAVRLIEQIAIHPQRVEHQDRQQKFRCAAAPTQVQWVVQQRGKPCRQSGQPVRLFGDLRQPCRQPEQRQQQGSPEPEVLPILIRAHGGHRSSARCKSLRGRCKSSSLQTVSPNTLAISRTSSNARRSSPAGICARKPFRLVEHNTADSGDGTVYEHNYSRMNEGGCVMFCLEEAIHNTFRGNVSYDDLGGTISPSQNPDALLEHNTFYLRDGVPFVRARMDGGSYTENDDTILPLP